MRDTVEQILRNADIKTWCKHPADQIVTTVDGIYNCVLPPIGSTVDKVGLLITTISRHRKSGEFQGYIVIVKDHWNYKKIYFKKGYYYRESVIMLAVGDYIREYS